MIEKNKYRVVRNYHGLRQGELFPEGFSVRLFGCFRLLPNNEFERLESFAGKPLLTLPVDYSPTLTESDLCEIFRDYLLRNRVIKFEGVRNESC